MFDLLGYWGGVTIFMWVVLSGPLYCLGALAHMVVKWASRGRVSISYRLSDYADYYMLKTAEVGVIIGVISACFWAPYVLVAIIMAFDGTFANFPSLMRMASDLSRPLAPVTGYITVVGVVAVLGALIGRKGFDFYFNVKDRLDKLTSKASKKL